MHITSQKLYMYINFLSLEPNDKKVALPTCTASQSPTHPPTCSPTPTLACSIHRALIGTEYTGASYNSCKFSDVDMINSETVNPKKLCAGLGYGKRSGRRMKGEQQQHALPLPRLFDLFTAVGNMRIRLIGGGCVPIPLIGNFYLLIKL
jgi:hypothetical protein